MHPVICQIGPFTVFSYGLMLAAAFLAGSWLAVSRAKKESIDPEMIMNLSLIAVISGIAGARVFYVIENADYFLKKPLETIMFQRGGLSFFGGLITGTLCGAAYLKKKKASIYRVLDLMAPFLALGQAIGRIGCLLNGCCFGKASLLIPIQIYSSFILVFIFAFLRFLQEKPHKEGKIFFAYLILYSTKRFFIEFWRADNPPLMFNLSLFQIISILLFLFSAWKVSRR
ncbi:MAG: prolipoprotein diacylglyceryl transferase [Candidatus Omnitrophica bacterium]|nr:prolipoprotein diacylglyceryl transferase [Candidatus Omnitrophota bacterium]MDD5552914.1 prolipoprotein diacylglyceryl transferase [Candidatus Omnitrophota bacterium]